MSRIFQAELRFNTGDRAFWLRFPIRGETGLGVLGTPINEKMENHDVCVICSGTLRLLRVEAPFQSVTKEPVPACPIYTSTDPLTNRAIEIRETYLFADEEAARTAAYTLIGGLGKVLWLRADR